MSMLAGCTPAGSKGSMPMRPDAIAARMSRSESTTAAKYGVGGAREREDLRTQIRPRADDIVGAVDALAREAPQDLDRVRARGPPHRDVRVRVADDDTFLGAAPKARHRVLGEIGRGLGSGDGVAAEVDVDLTGDAEAAEDALAVRGAFARDRGLQQPGLVERMQRLARTLVQLGRRDHLAVIDVAVFSPVPLGEVGREIGPGHAEDRFKWKTRHRPDALERQRSAAVRLDDAIRGVDDEADAVGQRPIEVPENRAERHADTDGAAGPAAARGSRSRVGLPASPPASCCSAGGAPPLSLARIPLAASPAAPVSPSPTAAGRGNFGLDGKHGLFSELPITRLASSAH